MPTALGTIAVVQRRGGLNNPDAREEALQQLEDAPVGALEAIGWAWLPALVGGLLGRFTGEGSAGRVAVFAGAGAAVGVGGGLFSRWFLLKAFRWAHENAREQGR